MVEDDRPLNAEQLRVVQALHGPLLVLATVGSGKTHVLAHRAAQAASHGFEPRRMLAITFTNKAAHEMRARLLDVIGDPSREMQIYTFHGFCSTVVRQEAKALALSPTFTIYDEQDQDEVIRLVLREMDDRWMGGEKNLGTIRNTISNYKRRLIYPTSPKTFQTLDADTQEGFSRYQELLESYNALDFDDLVARVAVLFHRDGATLATWQERFDWIQVDEVQDTTLVEYDIVANLARNHRNVALFGDRDQSIYGWRGAQPSQVIEQFQRAFDPTSLTLAQNYRSTGTILEAAHSLISASRETWTRELVTENPMGEPIELHRAVDEQDEATRVALQIESFVRGQRSLAQSDIAVLSRTNFEAVAVANALADKQIDHLTIEEFEFFRRTEVKDALAYLRFIAYPRDGIALRRLLLRPTRGITPVTIARLEEHAESCGTTLTDFCDSATIQSGDPCHELLALGETCVVCFDVETTGTDASVHDVIQIGAVKLLHGKVVERFSRFIRPGHAVGASERIHGISDTHLELHGESAELVLNDFLEFSRGAVLAGHNVEFDLDFISATAARFNRQIPPTQTFDTMHLARRALSLRNYRLSTVAAHLGVDEAPTHRADVDASVTAEVLMRLSELIAGSQEDRQRLVRLHGEQFTPLADDVSRWREASHSVALDELLQLVLVESGYTDFLVRRMDRPEQRKGNLDELLQLIRQKQSELPADPAEALREFLRHAALARNVDRLVTRGDAVAVLTVYQAKGLEFPAVFVVGVHDGNIPHYRSIGEPAQLEEERRCLYVALTRAKERLFLSYPRTGRNGRQNQPSRFLRDIPARLIADQPDSD